MRRVWLLTIPALLALAGAAATVLGAWTPWADRYAQGVDVSAHQGPIDWRALRASGVRFAYIKASEGADYADPRFRANWADAERAGLYRGAYHYFTLCRSGASQAANFLRTAPRGAGALPPAVDLEHKGPCRRGPTTTDVVSELRVYLDAVEAGYGMRPILYTTREFHDAHLADFPRERFWIRSLYTPPSFRREDWVIWQHHNMARRRGVTGPVDLDAFRGDDRALAAFAHAEPQT